jgi:hypothetical protein
LKVKDIRSKEDKRGESFLYDKAKLILTNAVTDLADIPRISGTIVLGGQAVHLAKASVPEYMIEQYDVLLALENDRCQYSEAQYELHINNIAREEIRRTHTSLFVLPEGFAFSDDFATCDATPYIMDRPMVVTMRALEVKKELEPGGLIISQKFYPAFFEMRLLSCDAASKKLKSKSKAVASISSYFGGMVIDDQKNKGEPKA